MLKFFFWCLLAVNLVLFALGRGYLGNFSTTEHEPGRLQNQLNADKLTLMTAADVARASTPPVPATVTPAPVAASTPAPATPAVAAAAPAPAPKPAAPLQACVEVGNFTAADARRFESAIAPLGLEQSHHSVQGQEISSYIVYIPPQSSKENADKKVAELKSLGVTNYFVINDNSPMHWAISLGVFKSEVAAQTLLAALTKQGVHSARVNPRYAPGKQVAYQLHELDSQAKASLDKIVGSFNGAASRACK